MDNLKIIYIDENPDMSYVCKRKSDRIIPIMTKSGVEFGWVDPGVDNKQVRILIDRSIITHIGE